MRGVTITVQTSPPVTIIAGDSVAFTMTYADYAAPTWSLNWALSGASSKAVDSTDNGTSHDLALTATETASLGAGSYQWRLRATDGTTTTTVETGTLVVTPDIGEALPGDLLSFYEKTIPILQAALTNTLSGEMKMYMINGRQVQTLGIDELQKLLDDYTQRVAIERGEGFGRAVRYSYRGSVVEC